MTALDRVVHSAVKKRTDSLKLSTQIVSHIRGKPVNNKADEETLVLQNQSGFIRIGDLIVATDLRNISRNSFVGNFFEVFLEHLPVGRIVNMINGGLVLYRKINRKNKVLINRI